MTRARKWLRRLGIVACWILGVLLVLWSTAEIWTRHELKGALARAREVGPLEWAALLPPEPPAAENGRWEFDRAAALLEPESKRLREGPPKTEDATWREETLAACAEALTQARAATDRASIHHSLDAQGQQLAALPLPHLSNTKLVATLLREAARSSGMAGHTGKALADLGRMSRLSRSLECESILVSMLVGCAVDGMTCETADDLLKSGAAARPEDLERLASLLRTTPGLKERTLVAERAFGLDCFVHLVDSRADMSSFLGSDPPVPMGTWLAYPARPWIRHEASCYLDYMTEAIRCVKTGRNPPSEPEGFLARLLCPALEKTMLSMDQRDARSGALRWALTLRAAHARTGRLPAALGPDLLADNPQDPFAKGPFTYTPDPDGRGFRVASIGTLRDGKPITFHWRLP